MNKGFYIKAVIATGQAVQEVRIDFQKGCNLIFGRSNCGKSHILDIIDFLLGKRGNPKKVKEGEGYETFYLEIATYQDDSVFTLQRKLNGTSILVKPTLYHNFHNDVKGVEYAVSSKSGKKRESISSFLLKLNGFEDSIELKKSATAKQSLTFSLLRRLFLVREGHVVSEKPIFYASEESTEETKEKSLIYYLTTGNDDSNFTPESQKEIQKASINGKMSFIEDVIKEKEAEIEAIGPVGHADFSDDTFFKRYKKIFESTEQDLNQAISERCNLEEHLSEYLSHRLFLETFINRLRLLKKHYDVDLARYDFIFQGHQLFESLANESCCPVCKSPITETQLHPEFASSIKAEVNELYKRIKEADEMIEKQEYELSVVLSNISRTSKEIEALSSKCHSMTLQVEDIKETLLRYQRNIETNSRHSSLVQEITKLKDHYSTLEDELKSISKKKSAYKRSSNITEEFCKSLELKLNEWHIRDVSPIEFDEKSFDFTIGGKGRLTCGKGERGVTCTAIFMTLVEFCINQDIPFTRTLIVDSPITAHFASETSNPEEVTQKAFFKYCNEKVQDYQLIIIDNKSPKKEERKELHNINYIEFDTSSRAGFYPAKD
ncbi:AAA family ATPase [Bacteroides acidifaciens]|uniref:AAA family ATPase n=1 Tax=Bacteroides acidifaciens TaxID=85831 RepID=UPI002676ACCE|nr:AAA family ATPase [Bacteroides acidifaciens]